jgi:predicted peptidase
VKVFNTIMVSKKHVFISIISIICAFLLGGGIFLSIEISPQLARGIKLASAHESSQLVTPPSSGVNTAAHYGFKTYTFTNAHQSIRYYLYVPVSYNPAHKYPLVLFLHGGGERIKPGATESQIEARLFQNAFVQIWGANSPVGANPEVQQHWPSFVVIPQMVQSQQWVNVDVHKGSYTQPAQPSVALQLSKELLDSLQKQYTGIDANRLYITGYSNGGFGTWDAIERWPNYFAAAVPIAGAGDPTKTAGLAHLPIWAFHGAKDPTVPVSGSRQMIAAIRAAGGHPQYTEFPAGGHGSTIWGPVYGAMGSASGNIPGFFSWLFAQKR